MASYWLSEPATPRLRDRRRSRSRDRRRRRHRLRCGAPACPGGQRVRLNDAREVAEGASGRNGGFALRGMPAAFDVTTESVGEETARAMMAWTERAIDTIESLAGDAFRRVGSLRLAVDEEERDELRAEYEALVAAGFEAEWIETLRASARGPVHGRAAPRARRRAAAGALGASARGPRCRGWGRDSRAHARRVPRRVRRSHRRRLHRRLPERPPRRDRGADHPDARPGDRDGAGPGAPLRDAALRTARLRLLAPGRGRAHRRGRLPGRVVRLRVHRRRAPHRAGADRACTPSSTT